MTATFIHAELVAPKPRVGTLLDLPLQTPQARPAEEEYDRTREIFHQIRLNRAARRALVIGQHRRGRPLPPPAYHMRRPGNGLPRA
jgi:hypothetical protein